MSFMSDGAYFYTFIVVQSYAKKEKKCKKFDKSETLT